MSKNPVVKQKGFSLIELLVVILIMLAVAALAVPSFMSAIATYKLRSSLSQLAGVLQQQRSLAVRLNRSIVFSTTVVSGDSFAFVDTNGDGTWNSGESGMVMPQNESFTSAGHPGDATSGLNYTATTGTGVVPRFNSRGLPCIMVGNFCQNIDTSSSPPVRVGFVIYVRRTGTFGTPQWGAVTITPAGRVQTWVWSGSSYHGQ